MRPRNNQNPVGLVFALCGFAFTLHGQILDDTFSGATINPSVWQTSTPFSDSSITASNGFAVFQNRGRLLTVASLPTAVEISGSFAFTGNPHDGFVIQTRCDGATTASPKYFDRGIEFGFVIQGDGGQTTGNIWISRYAYPTLPPADLARGTFAMTTNVFYSFRITDDGAHTALYITDLSTPLLEGNDTSQFGHQLGLFNRESAGIRINDTVELDYLTVRSLGPSVAIRVQQVEVCWDSQPANTYQLQYKSAITANAWTNLGDSVPGDGTTHCILDPVPRGEPQRFYRVITLP